MRRKQLEAKAAAASDQAEKDSERYFSGEMTDDELAEYLKKWQYTVECIRDLRDEVALTGGVHLAMAETWLSTTQRWADLVEKRLAERAGA